MCGGRRGQLVGGVGGWVVGCNKTQSETLLANVPAWEQQTKKQTCQAYIHNTPDAHKQRNTNTHLCMLTASNASNHSTGGITPSRAHPHASCSSNLLSSRCSSRSIGRLASMHAKVTSQITLFLAPLTPSRARPPTTQERSAGPAVVI